VCDGLSTGTALRSGDDHVDVAAAAFGAHQPFRPIGHRRFGTVTFRHLARVGFDLVLAGLAPDDEPNPGAGSIGEGHRLTRLRSLPLLSARGSSLSGLRSRWRIIALSLAAKALGQVRVAASRGSLRPLRGLR
jgi:hypothetical protein